MHRLADIDFSNSSDIGLREPLSDEIDGQELHANLRSESAFSPSEELEQAVSRSCLGPGKVASSSETRTWPKTRGGSGLPFRLPWRPFLYAHGPRAGRTGGGPRADTSFATRRCAPGHFGGHLTMQKRGTLRPFPSTAFRVSDFRGILTISEP